MPEFARKSGYDVFISYRREGAGAQARLIQTDLQGRKFHAFLDVTDLDRGEFDETLLHRIAETPNFIVVLSPNALDRCVDKNDWLRREIACALRTNRNVIPVLMPNFMFPLDLPDEIRDLPRHNGVDYSHVYFDGMLQRIITMMGAAPRPPQKKWRLRISIAISIVVSVSVLTVGMVMYLPRAHSLINGTKPTQQEVALQQEANLLRLGRRFDEAIAKDREIEDLHGALASSAANEIAAMTKLQEQESSLLADGKAAEGQNDLARAKADYQQMMDLHAARELEAIESFNVVAQKMSGATDADITKKNFANGVTAFNHGEYAIAKASFDQVLTRAPTNWQQRTQAEDYARKSTGRARQQQHLASAQNYFNGKNFDAAREEARQVLGTSDPDPALVRQAQDLVARIPATPATLPPPSQPSAAAEIQALMRDAEGLIQQGQFKDAIGKAASVERLSGDADTLRQAIRTAEEARYQELNSRYLMADKQNMIQMQDLLAAFKQFAGNAVNREADSKKYVDQITAEIAALSAVRAGPPVQPVASSALAAPVVNPADVQTVLNRYAEAVAGGDLAGVKAVRQLSAGDEKKMADSLKVMKGKGFALRNCTTPEIVGDTARASCNTVLTGSKDTPPGHVVFSLRRVNGQWMIVP